MLFVAARRGCRIGEVPITFVERREGESKLSRGVLVESLIAPWRLRLRPLPGRVDAVRAKVRRFRHVHARLPAPGPARLLSGVQRQRNHREHGVAPFSRRAGHVRLRSHRRQRRQHGRHPADPRRAGARSIRRSASSITRRTAATAARCAPASRRRRKEFIFYTDGDAQYDPAELAALWPHMTAGRRPGERLQDQPVRSAAPHHHRPHLPPHGQALFGLKVRDVDCDFRLMRRHDLRSRPAGEEQRRHLPGDDEEDPGCRFPHRRGAGPSLTTARTGSRSSSISGASGGPAIDVMRLWFALRRARASTLRQPRRRTSTSSLRDRLSRFYTGPPRDDHRRPRLHRQQPRPPAGRSSARTCCWSTP